MKRHKLTRREIIERFCAGETINDQVAAADELRRAA